MTEDQAIEIVIHLANRSSSQALDLPALANVLTKEMPVMHGKVSDESLSIVAGVAATLLSMWIKQSDPSLGLKPEEHLLMH